MNCIDQSIDMSKINTVIFLDCDGVLNISLSEKSGSVAFDPANLEMCLKMLASQDGSISSTEKKIAEALCAIADKEIGHGERGSYRELMDERGTGLSVELVRRLAKLIGIAGQQCLVVLSSTWRHPRHAGRVARLEQNIADHLRRPFCFQATTALVSSKESPCDRLQLMCGFVEELCALRGRSAAPLKVLVLEDFFCSPLGTWRCQGLPMDSEAAVEWYLERVSGAEVEAKLVHTYDAWAVPSGDTVQIGCGLTMQKFRAAEQFLAHDRDQCVPGKPQPSGCMFWLGKLAQRICGAA